VPLPRHSRNSTGSATGEGQHGSSTTIAAMTQVFPLCRRLHNGNYADPPVMPTGSLEPVDRPGFQARSSA
jgi:hypothetical protein